MTRIFFLAFWFEPKHKTSTLTDFIFHNILKDICCSVLYGLLGHKTGLVARGSKRCMLFCSHFAKFRKPLNMCQRSQLNNKGQTWKTHCSISPRRLRVMPVLTRPNTFFSPNSQNACLGLHYDRMVLKSFVHWKGAVGAKGRRTECSSVIFIN